MKRCAALLFLMALFPAAIANANDLFIFSDVAFTDSTLSDTTPRIVDLYVVHANHFGSVGVEFGTTASAGFTGVWLGDSSSYVTIGNSTTGVAIGYGACLSAPVLVLTMSYQFYGTSDGCSNLKIGPGSRFAFIICDNGCFGEYPCNGGSLSRELRRRDRARHLGTRQGAIPMMTISPLFGVRT